MTREPPVEPLALSVLRDNGFFGFALTAENSSTTTGELCVDCTAKGEGRVMAYRNHAHSHGRMVMSEVWHRGGLFGGVLGARAPREAQLFYPLHRDYTLRDGDRLRLRCSYDLQGVGKRGLSRGGEEPDEMCNQYLLHSKGLSLTCGGAKYNSNCGGAPETRRPRA